jgi:VanZ family protein
VKAVLTIAAMGALDEYIQSFFPYRHGSVGDWVDVSAAMVTACSLYWLWQRRTN